MGWTPEASVVCVWQGRKKKTEGTAIEVCPVHVYPERGAETPRSRLRGEGARSCCCAPKYTENGEKVGAKRGGRRGGEGERGNKALSCKEIESVDRGGGL